MASPPEDSSETDGRARLASELAELRHAEALLQAQNSELLENQIQLEEAKQDYAEIQDLAPIALLTLTPSGLVRSANLAAAELFEQERSRLTGRLAVSFFCPEDRARLRELLSRAVPEEPRTCEAELLLGPSKKRPVRLWLQRSARRQDVFHLALEDAGSEQDDPATRELLEQSKRDKDRFIAILSHELRTPLTPVLAAAHKLMEARNVSGELREIFRMILRNANVQASLIQDLLDLTALTHGKIELDRRLLDVHETLRSSLEAVAESVQSLGLQVELELAAEAFHTYADPARLQQVVGKLLSNAIECSPRGGTLQVRTWNTDGSLSFEVAHQGSGLPPQGAARLFDTLESGDGERPGTLRLGLMLSRGLVELHGGRISVASAGPGQGMRFVVELKAVRASSQQEPEAPSAAQPLPSARRPRADRPVVLLVEDHEDTAAVVGELLETEGYEVVVADSAEKALAVDLERVDVIVSDLGLPDGSGLELLPKLRAKRHTPALAMSGYGTSSDLAASAAAGFDSHLVKPVDGTELTSTLRKLLGRA